VLRGIDVRKQGSGNMNVGRLLKVRAFGLFDALKGFVPTLATVYSSIVRGTSVAARCSTGPGQSPVAVAASWATVIQFSDS
jgi:glycerol-3-phosphate acyltransferase PlsY